MPSKELAQVSRNLAPKAAKKTAKKAAKKVAAKAAKKAAKKVAKKAANRPTSHDLRRAYEHLGRIEALQSGLPQAAARTVSELAALAQKELAVHEGKNAADLLRAAEHLSFAALAADSTSRVSPELQAAIVAEFDDLIRRAKDRAARPAEPLHAAVTALYKETLQMAQASFAAGSYRRALETARAAEALTHVERKGPARLPGPARPADRIAS